MGTSIYVCNLPLNVDGSFLGKLFSQYGEVFSVKIVKDRQTNASRGFAFVRMSERHSENAIQHLNGYSIAGQRIKVQQDFKSSVY